MAFDVNKPADTQTIALGPQDIRENFRALKDDKIVNALKVADYSPGNSNGNIPVSNGTVNTNLNADMLDGKHAGNSANNVLILDGNGLTPLANIPAELTGKNAPTATNATNHISNATGAHAASAISNTPAGNIVATTVQDAINELDVKKGGGFVTDKSKCSLSLSFKDGLADKTRGIVPIGYESANKWSDNFINDSTTKTNATNISATLKQFDGNEGLFGSGIAVEKSRTNLFLCSDDLTNAVWTKINCTVTLDRIENGMKIFKVVATADGNVWIVQNQNEGSGQYTVSASIINTSGKTFEFNKGSAPAGDFASAITKLTRIYSAHSGANQAVGFYIGLLNAAIGDTFYISQPQLEAGSFPTSYIATGSSAVTRPAGNIKIDRPELNGSSVYSISLWFNPNYSYNTDAPTIYPKGILQIGTKHWLTYHNTLNKFLFYTNGVSGTCISNAYTNDTDFKKLHHILLVQNGATASMYIDNVKYVVTGTTASLTSSLINLGLATDPVSQANGTISDFHVFNYALTDSEIKQIYESGLKGIPITVANEVTSEVGDRLVTVQHALVADNATTAAACSGNAATATSATNADTLDTLHASAFALAGHTTHTGEASSLATNGYKKFADGTIMQWGQSNWASGEGSKLVYFPLAFPLEPKSIQILPYTTSMTYTPSKISAAHGGNYFTAYRDTTDAPINFYWFAIGY